MTQSEFWKSYLAGSKLTEERAHELGLFAMPCACSYEGCEGWQAMRLSFLRDMVKEIDLYNFPKTLC